jgi:hypothetical protein
VLSRHGRRSAEDSRLVAQLAEAAPLADPDRFGDAHRLVMRALEIHDRDGWRHPRTVRFGPVTPILEYLAEMVAKYVVRSYTSDLARRLNVLYARREAQSLAGSPERNLLEQARIETERVAAGYRGATFPAVVSGIAALPLVAGLARGVGGLNWLDTTVQVVLGLILFALFGLISYVLLQGSSTARQRARLLLDAPLQALWATLGRAGRPPEDDAATFAAVAIVLTFLGWFVVPALVALAFTVY